MSANPFDPTKLTRREFNQALLWVGGGAALALVAGAGWRWIGRSPGTLRSLKDADLARAKHWFVSPYTTDIENLKSAKAHMFLAFTSIETGENGRIAVPIRGHASLKHPRRAYSVLLFPKFGKNSVEVELSPDPSIKVISASPDTQFYGHGVFSPRGTELFDTEVLERDKSGLVSVRDPLDYRELARIDSGGAFPHDLHFSADGKYLTVANGGIPHGTPACVSVVDIASGKIIEKVTPREPEASFAHLAPSPDGEDWLIATTPRDDRAPGRVYIHRRGSGADLLPIPEAILGNLHGQALSLGLLPERHLCGVTYPDSDRVLFWNYREKVFLKELSLPRPTGFVLAPDRRHFLAGNRTGIIRHIDVSSLEAVIPSGPELPGGNISHASLLEF